MGYSNSGITSDDFEEMLYRVVRGYDPDAPGERRAAGPTLHDIEGTVSEVDGVWDLRSLAATLANAQAPEIPDAPTWQKGNQRLYMVDKRVDWASNRDPILVASRLDQGMTTRTPNGWPTDRPSLFQGILKPFSHPAGAGSVVEINVAGRTHLLGWTDTTAEPLQIPLTIQPGSTPFPVAESLITWDTPRESIQLELQYWRLVF